MKYFCLAVFSLLCFLQSVCHAGNPEIQAGSFEVKVMTFNIRYCRAKDGPDNWQYRRQMVVNVIKNPQVDVVGLQEAEKPQIKFLQKSLNEFAFLVTYSDGKAHGSSNALLYRKSHLAVDDWGTFWLSDIPEVPGSTTWGNKNGRFCTWARLVEKKSGMGFYFFNVHLDHLSQYARLRSAILIAERIRQRVHKDPFVLTGDMNAEEDNDVIAFFKGQPLVIDNKSYTNPAPLVDTFRIKHGPQADAGTFNGFGTRERFNKIDYIFTRKSTQVLGAEIIKYNKNGRYPSDHCPVVASLRLPERPVVNGEYKDE